MEKTAAAAAVTPTRQQTQFVNPPAVAEETSLPVLELRGRYGTAFSAYVTSIILSPKRQIMSGPGFRMAHGLWFLSLVAARGQGSTLQALYAALVNNPPKDVSLSGLEKLSTETVSALMLGSRAETLVERGYRTAWNYDQCEVNVPQGGKLVRALHGVLEPKALTLATPPLAQGGPPKQSHRPPLAAKGKGGKPKPRRAENFSDVTALPKGNADDEGQGGAGGGEEERPFFLLTVPGSHVGDRAWLAQLYLSFLDTRLPLPLLPEWADFLLADGLAREEITPLLCWSYPMPLPGKVGAEGQPPTALPLIAEAYLCTPDPAHILACVQEHLKGDR